jgi:signal transduction histidine kinase
MPKVRPPRQSGSAREGIARGGWPVCVVGAVALAVAAVAVPGAVDWYGKPVAGALVGPDAVVSNVMNLDWDGARQGLHFPDQVVAIEGRRLDRLPPSERGRRLSQIVQQAGSAGATHVTVEIRQGNSEGRLRLAIERLDGATWWLVAGALFFSGALFLAAGLIALWASPRGHLAHSTAVVASASALLMFTLFDYHTSYRLVPIFLVCYALLPGAICVLALRLPDDAPLLLRFPWLERATTVAGIAVAAYFNVPFLRGRPMPRLHEFWASLFGASFLFFLLTFAVRYVLAKGHRRDILRALTLALVPPLVTIGLLMAAEPLRIQFTYAQVLAYPALALIPIAVAVAFVRYDLWGSRVLLSRLLTRLTVGAIACTLAIAAGAALATAMGAPFGSAVIAATASGVLAAVLVVVALHAAEVYVFPSRAGYKPSIEQLSADLISITSPDEVGRAIERTVRRWLPCEHIRLVLIAPCGDDAADGTAIPVPAGEQRTGEILAHAPPAAESSELVLPVVFGAERLAVLEVGAKPGGALFTSEDLDLLNTVVNQGALALAHARAYQELEQRRKQQAAAWRGEREALVETVAAEISHEVRYPLNFFRSLFGRAGTQPLSANDLDVGREEVERLERLAGGLRRMTGHRIHRRIISVRDLCGRAEVLLRDACAGRVLAFAGEAELALRCDPDQATQILVNLLANALQATDAAGHVGVSWHCDGKEACIEVWDDGPGFAGDATALFAPWYTTKERGTGLGLAITHRLVRAHSWSIAATRQGGRTLFVITIPQADVVLTEEHPAHERATEVS